MINRGQKQFKQPSRDDARKPQVFFTSSTRSSQRKPSSRILSIISNKGGVGKSHLAINISYALSRMGRKVLLIDSDLGSGTTGVKFGLYPKNVLKDFLLGKKWLAELIVPTRFPGLEFIGGSSGDFDLANMNHARKLKFIRSYTMLADEGRYDDIILDLGASIEKRVIDFALSSNHVIIITTPQDVISGYGCLKGSFIRFIELVSRSEQYEGISSVFRPLIVANQIRCKGQGLQVFNVMSNLIRESTNEILVNMGKRDGVFRIEPSFLGEIPYVRDTLIKAEMARQPVMEMFPRSGATIAYRSIANALQQLPTHQYKIQPEFLAQWVKESAEDFESLIPSDCELPAEGTKWW